jgi:type I restriction-modification system DNA methylase subunit
MKEKLTQSQLEQYLSKAAWILKGPVDASDFKVYIFPLLFFKRISDVYDEEYRLALEESKGEMDNVLLPEFHQFEISIATLRELPILIPPSAIIEEIINLFNSIDRFFGAMSSSFLDSKSFSKEFNQLDFLTKRVKVIC